MIRRKNKSQKKWQKNYINDVFSSSKDKTKKFSKLLFENPDLLNQKNSFLPETLFKFYSPTYDNIFDIENQKLWFSHPNHFNDLYDCKVGYEFEEYERKKVIEFLKSNIISNENPNLILSDLEINRISNTTTDYFKANPHPLLDLDNIPEYFDDVIRKLSVSKSYDFMIDIYSLRRKIKKDISNQIDLLHKSNIRVACFAKLDKDEHFPKIGQMWAHYADNHKGFCVEYDMSKFKNELSLSDSTIVSDKELFLNERLEFTLKSGLFEVIYSSNRVKIPYTKLNYLEKLSKDEIENNNYFSNLLYKAYIHKSPVWSYEKEWRIILDESVCDYFDKKIPFPYAKCIYLGARIEKKKKDMLIRIAETLNIEIKEMFIQEINYELESRRYQKEETNLFKEYNHPF